MVGPLGFWRELQAYQLGAVQRLGLQPAHCLLDLGCGPLQGGIPFISYLEKERYVGIDRRAEAVEMGREEITRHGLDYKKPRLFVTESFGDIELGETKLDFVWASQVLYYFHEPTMHQLFALVSRRLNPTGVMAGDILGPNSDRSFLRPPLPPVHTGASLDVIAKAHGLRVVERGTIQDFAYPRRLGLRHNVMLEITHRRGQP